MSIEEESQPQPGTQTDKRVEIDHQKAQRLYGPPALVLSTWSLFSYGDGVQFLNPHWDYVTLFTFATLVCGFLLLPFVVFPLAQKWRVATESRKQVIGDSFKGWATAWGILVIGFFLVDWEWSFIR